MERSTRAITGILLTVLFAAMVGCGGSDTAEQASCQIERSELGPFSSDTTLGASMSEDQARARMAQDNIIEWVAITADGPWGTVWDEATSELGSSIHNQLSWLDVSGELHGLYAEGDSFDFDGLRVSRSFQGKIENSGAPLYLPIQDVGVDADFDAECEVTEVVVGDEFNPNLLDVTTVADPAT